MQLGYVMHRMTSRYARFHSQNYFLLRSSKNNLSFHPLNYDRILFPKMLVHTALMAELAQIILYYVFICCMDHSGGADG